MYDSSGWVYFCCVFQRITATKHCSTELLLRVGLVHAVSDIHTSRKCMWAPNPSRRSAPLHVELGDVLQMCNRIICGYCPGLYMYLVVIKCIFFCTCCTVVCIAYSGKLLKEKSFVDYNFWQRRLAWIACFCCSKGHPPPNFAEKTATKSRNSQKFSPSKVSRYAIGYRRSNTLLPRFVCMQAIYRTVCLW